MPIFSAPENYSPCAIVWRCLRDPTFSHFTRTPTWPDGQTDTRRQLIAALASVARVKISCINRARTRGTELQSCDVTFSAYTHTALYPPRRTTRHESSITHHQTAVRLQSPTSIKRCIATTTRPQARLDNASACLAQLIPTTCQLSLRTTKPGRPGRGFPAH